MMPVKKNWPFIILLLSLAGLLALLIIFRSFFIENILRPIGLIFWLGWRVIMSVNQSFYWTIVILISAFLVIRMLPRESPSDEDRQQDAAHKVTNPYLDWLLTFTHSTSNCSALENLRQRMRDLTTSFVSLTYRIADNKAAETLQAKASPLSKESQAFLFSEKEVPRDFPGKINLRIAFLLASLRKGQISRVPKIVHQPVNEILSFMEEKAKKHYEH